MDATLHALANLLLQAIPTIALFLFLTFYLKQAFFKPLAKILDERRKATEGVRELSQRAFEAADRKNSEFETALQLARADISEANEALRRTWEKEEADTLAKARSNAETQVQEAKRQIAAELDRVEADLDAQVEPLSEQIVSSLLRRRAA